MKTLIIGRGEVGTALAGALGIYAPKVIDIGEIPDGSAVDVMHICFPFTDAFIGEAFTYQSRYAPKVATVIHSTVPVGTSRKCSAIHSPIRGQHPNLQDGIRTFPKMIGGRDASLVADYFRRAGLKIELYDKQETTELAKLLDTEAYRVSIEFAQRAKSLADKHLLSFHEVYTLPTIGYNAGYTALGHPEYVRPVLQPIAGEIGGHCVLPNKALIEKD